MFTFNNRLKVQKSLETINLSAKQKQFWKVDVFVCAYRENDKEENGGSSSYKKNKKKRGNLIRIGEIFCESYKVILWKAYISFYFIFSIRKSF